MKRMIRKIIEKLLQESYQEAYKNNHYFGLVYNIDESSQKVFGDYYISLSFVANEKEKKEWDKKYKTIIEGIKKSKNFKKYFKEVNFVKPVFVNFFLTDDYLQKQVGKILKQKESFGRLRIGRGQKVNVEFISANPTGPITLGNGRGGFCGDTLSNVLQKASYKVCREYYINDRGEQIIKLGHSVLGDEEAVYKGHYIDNLRRQVKEKAAEKAGERAGKIILEKMIKPAVRKMGIKFDVWFSEKNLYKKSGVKKVLNFLKSKNLVYEKDGAVWFKSTKFRDDKDRVLVKAGGEETYFLSDIAYLKNKLGRGFKKLIFFWGADHAGYVPRIKGVIEALGFEKEKAEFIIMQLVRLFQEGKEIRMSKRTGLYVTIDELIDEVGLDVARFFFLTKSPDTHFNFDLNLAKEQSEKNPVYYIQYSHARICSILRKARANYKLKTKNYKLLVHPSELELIKQLIRFPEIIEDTAKDYQVQRLPQYAYDLATIFNQFYRDCKVITEDKNLQQARLALVLAVKIVSKNTLDLMGISSPEKM